MCARATYRVDCHAALAMTEFLARVSPADYAFYTRTTSTLVIANVVKQSSK